jgi:competence protein ComER
MKIGIIGTGNMGRVLIEALIDGKAIAPSSLTITNRTLSKALEIKENYQDINVAETGKDVAEQSSLLFICVKPHDVHNVITIFLPS